MKNVIVVDIEIGDQELSCGLECPYYFKTPLNIEFCMLSKNKVFTKGSPTKECMEIMLEESISAITCKSCNQTFYEEMGWSTDKICYFDHVNLEEGEFYCMACCDGNHSNPVFETEKELLKCPEEDKLTCPSCGTSDVTLQDNNIIHCDRCETIVGVYCSSCDISYDDQTKYKNHVCK